MVLKLIHTVNKENSIMEITLGNICTNLLLARSNGPIANVLKWSIGNK